MASDSLSGLDPAWKKLARRQLFTQAEAEAFFALSFRLSTVASEATLVRHGEEPENCCILLSGFAYRQKTIRNGGRRILFIHMPGDFVNLQNSIIAVTDYSVQMLTNGRVAFIPRAEIADLVLRFPGIAQALWLDTSIDSAIEREHLVNVGRRDARARVAHLFCEFAFRQQISGPANEDVYRWPMTNERLADATGLTAVHISRKLKELREIGAIETSPGMFRIRDWSILLEIADFSSAYLHDLQPRANAFSPCEGRGSASASDI